MILFISTFIFAVIGYFMLIGMAMVASTVFGITILLAHRAWLRCAIVGAWIFGVLYYATYGVDWGISLGIALLPLYFYGRHRVRVARRIPA